MSSNLKVSTRIALIGGGPTALYLLQKLIQSGRRDISVTIFERSDRVGVGMPYSRFGAEPEHVTNISWKEMPQWGEELARWLKEQDHTGMGYGPQEVMPRLVLGDFLEHLFTESRREARRRFPVQLKMRTEVLDILFRKQGFSIVTTTGSYEYDTVFICIKIQSRCFIKSQIHFKK